MRIGNFDVYLVHLTVVDGRSRPGLVEVVRIVVDWWRQGELRSTCWGLTSLRCRMFSLSFAQVYYLAVFLSRVN